MFNKTKSDMTQYMKNEKLDIYRQDINYTLNMTTWLEQRTSL